MPFGIVSRQIPRSAARDSQYNRGTRRVSRFLQRHDELLLSHPSLPNDSPANPSLVNEEQSMDFPRSYDYDQDETTGMWRLVSPSGHLLYESRWHVHVARVCQRLNARFAPPESAIDARQFNPPPMMQAALMA
jgi:hypothetical protein